MSSAATRPGDRAAQRRATSRRRAPVLHIVSSPIIGRHLITLTGPIDVAGAAALAATLRRACTPGRRVLVDLVGVTFVAQAGLDVLLAAHRRLAACGGQLILAGASAHIRRFLQITGTDRVLNLQPHEAKPVSGPATTARRPGRRR